VAFFLGIDGGGSKTRCVLGDETSVLASGSAGACNVVRVGESCAQTSLEAAIHEACIQGGASPRDISCTCIGAAGASRAEIAKTLHRILSDVVGGKIEILGDLEVAFESAFGDQAGVIVIAGTGSLAYGRDAQGESFRAGGWGRVISDEGSGHWIGLEAIKASLRARDRGQKTSLLPSLIESLALKNIEEFIVHSNGDPQPDFAALFPVVLSAARAQDRIATEVLNQAGRELATLAEIVIAQLFHEADVSVATHGGVFASSSEVKNYFAAQLRARCPKANLISKEIDPAEAALQRARRGFTSAAAKS
jgi:glucosamine kinase